jgi:hypothetical protein
MGELNVSICERKNSHTQIWLGQTWCCLHDNPVLRSDRQIPTFQHTVPPTIFQKLVFQQCLKYLCIRRVNKATKMTSLILNKFQTTIFFKKKMDSRDNTAQVILHDAAHRFYQCFYFQNVIQFYRTLVNLTLILLIWRIQWAPNNACKW